MAEPSHSKFRLRIKLPVIFRTAAVVVMCATVLAIIVGFYKQRNVRDFRLKPEHAQLSKDFVAEVIRPRRSVPNG